MDMIGLAVPTTQARSAVRRTRTLCDVLGLGVGTADPPYPALRGFSVPCESL
jgi:hypothetical protein